MSILLGSATHSPPADTPNGALPVEQIGAASGTHRGARRLGRAACCGLWVVGWMLAVSVVVDPGHTVVSVSLRLSMVVEDLHGNRGLVR